MLGHGDPAFFVFFGGVAVALIAGVVYTALRLQLSIDQLGAYVPRSNQQATNRVRQFKCRRFENGS